MNLKFLFSTTLFLLSTLLFSQGFIITEKAPMPMAVSNNAVVEGWANDTAYVYSFAGIDSTKQYSGIHLKSFRYNTISDKWETLPDLPDTLGKIAAAASWVDSVIYIIGGYHVFANGNEVSSNKVHRFDTKTNTFLSDGAPVPVPIDDHVQAVWNDSLIYVITGWSNNGNVPDVQIYNPSTDSWLQGTPVPNSNTYKSFGASGTIVGNTIIYFGGANYSFNFPAQANLRIGQIDPQNPANITWSQSIPNNAFKGYRSACTFSPDGAHWLGGSTVTYNYNGIAYNGSGGVNPVNRNLISFGLSSNLDTAYIGGSSGLPMDLRGIASFDPYTKYIVGGMEANQKVSNKTLILNYVLMPGFNEEVQNNKLHIFPNPVINEVAIKFNTKKATYSITDLIGRIYYTGELNGELTTVNISGFPSGLGMITIQAEGKSYQKIFIKK